MARLRLRLGLCVCLYVMIDLDHPPSTSIGKQSNSSTENSLTLIWPSKCATRSSSTTTGSVGGDGDGATTAAATRCSSSSLQSSQPSAPEAFLESMLPAARLSAAAPALRNGLDSDGVESSPPCVCTCVWVDSI